MRKFILFAFLTLLLSCSSDPIVYTLTATADPAEGGQVVPEYMEYGEGDTAYVVATPSDEYVLESWSGDASGNANTLVITMDKNKDVTAHFVKKKYPLIIKIEGEGEVKQEVIKQGMARDYNSGTIVKLTAEPKDEWLFVRWRGDLTGNENPTQITIDGPKTVVAEFEKKKYPLTIEIIGEGQVSQKVIKPGAPKDYNSGTIVELEALSGKDWKFIEWRDDLTGNQNPQSITIDSPKKVTAVFEEDCSNFLFEGFTELTIFPPMHRVSCNGGNDGSTAAANVSGGLEPYSYSWTKDGDNNFSSASPISLSNISAGTYNLTVTDSKGCTVTGSYTVPEPPPIEINGVVTNLSENNLNDGSIDITVTGGWKEVYGFGNYSYDWDTIDGSGLVQGNEDQTGLSPGTYNLTVTDYNGKCPISKSFTITDPTNDNCNNGPVITATTSNFNGQNISCHGANDGTIDLTVSGGIAPYTYQWSEGGNTEDRTNLSAGIYSVTVTDSKGCTNTLEIDITEPDPLVITGAVSNYNGFGVSQNGASDGSIDITISGGVAGYNYNWTTANGSGLIQGNQDQSGLSPGTYNITVTDSNGCIISSTFTITEPEDTDPIIGTWTLTNEVWAGSGTWPDGQMRGCWKSGDEGSPDQYIFTQSSVTKKVWECDQDGKFSSSTTFGPLSWSNLGNGSYSWGGETIQVVFENNNTVMKLPFDDGNILQTWTKN